MFCTYKSHACMPSGTVSINKLMYVHCYRHLDSPIALLNEPSDDFAMANQTWCQLHDSVIIGKILVMVSLIHIPIQCVAGLTGTFGIFCGLHR